MAYEFIARNGVIAQDNSQVTGSLTVTNGITGSLFGTSSWATNAVTANTASYILDAVSASFAATGSYADNFTVKNTLTAQTLVVSVVSSSVVYSSGSNVFGNDLSNTQIFTGSVSITGSLAVNGTTATLGTGTINTVPKFTSANIIGDSNITDSGTLITLGSNTNISSGALGIGTSTLTGYSLRLAKSITGATIAYGISSEGTIQSDVTSEAYYNRSVATTAAASFTLTSLYHYEAAQSTFGAGSTVTNQYGFRVAGSLIGATNNYGFYGNIASGTNRWNIYMAGTANNYLAGALGIGTTSLSNISLSISKNITGATTSYGVYSNGTIQSDVTSIAYIFRSQPSTQATSFSLSTLVHYAADQGTIGASSSVTNQYGFTAGSSMVGATNNYGFYGNIPSSSGDWNLYMNGNADNFLSGSLVIGSTTVPGSKLGIAHNNDFGVNLRNIGTGGLNWQIGSTNNGYTAGGGKLIFTYDNLSANSILTLVQATKFVGINKTNPSASLDVSGSALITGSLNVSQGITGSLFGTASFATTASYFLTGSVTSASYAETSSYADNFTVANQLTATTLVVQTVSSSVVYSSGSNIFGNSLSNTQQFTGSVQITGSLSVDGQGTFTNSVGVGSTSLTGYNLRVSKNITGATTAYGVKNEGVIQSDVTSLVGLFSTTGATQATAFTVSNLRHYEAEQGTFGAGSTVTQQIGFHVGGTMTGATTNLGFRGAIQSGTNRWNIYMDGTANNYMAGALGIGSTSLTGVNFKVAKNITGATTSYNITSEGATQSDVTNQSNYYLSLGSTAAAAFTLSNMYHYKAQQGTFGLNSVVTNQYGFIVDSTLAGAANNYGFHGNIATSGSSNWNLYMNGTAPNYFAGALGIGSTSVNNGINLNMAKTMTGATTQWNIYNQSQVQSDVTVVAAYYRTNANTAASAFTLSQLFHYQAIQGTIGATSAVTSQFGFSVDASLIGATNNYGFFGNIAAGTNRWNIYMQGTANNYLAGNLGIKKTSPSVELDILGSAFITGSLDVTGSFEVVGRSLMTGSLFISSSAAAATVQGSGSAVFAVDGTSGRLFQVDDSLSGSLFSVNTSAGLPVIEAFSNNTVRIGQYGQQALFVSQSKVGIGKENALNGVLDVSGSTTMTGSLSVDGRGTFTDSVGIGSTSLTAITLRVAKNITGATTGYGIIQQGTVQSDVTSTAYGVYNEINTAASAFTLTNYRHFFAAGSTIGAGSTVTNQVGFFVSSNVTGATNNFAFYGDIAAATNRWNLYMNGTANNYLAGALGIGTTSLAGMSLRVSKNITGATTGYGVHQDGVVQSDVTSIAHGFTNRLQTQATAFTLPQYNHYYAVQVALGAGSVVTTQAGFFADSSLTSATNNYGFYGNIASGANRWNLFMGGTADNYLAGRLWIGTTSGTTALDVRGSAEAAITLGTSTTPYGRIFADATILTINSLNNVPLVFSTNAATSFNEKMRITVGGNVLIGTTTDAGFRLDVSGSGRFTSDLTVTGSLTLFGPNNNTPNIKTQNSSLILEGNAGLFASFGSQLRLTANQNAWTDNVTSSYFQIKTTGSFGSNNYVTFQGGTWASDAPFDRLQFASYYTSFNNGAYGTTPVPTASVEIINSNSGTIPLLQLKTLVGQTSNYVNITSGSTAGNVFNITKDGIVAINTTNTSTEGNLFLGAKGTDEGGQLVLQKGTSYNSASMLDNYQDQFRVLTGTDTSSNRSDLILSHVTRNLTIYGDVVAYGSSDKRLKENVQPIENALDKLDKIGGYTFDWNDNKEIHGHEGHDIGVIAQEIEEILPEVVATRDNGYKAVKYEKLTAFLIQVVKELKADNEDLRNEINNLKNK